MEARTTPAPKAWTSRRRSLLDFFLLRCLELTRASVRASLPISLHIEPPARGCADVAPLPPRHPSLPTPPRSRSRAAGGACGFEPAAGATGKGACKGACKGAIKPSIVCQARHRHSTVSSQPAHSGPVVLDHPSCPVYVAPAGFARRLDLTRCRAAAQPYTLNPKPFSLSQVPGCGTSLRKVDSPLHHRYKLCALHCTAECVLINGVAHRFCQKRDLRCSPPPAFCTSFCTLTAFGTSLLGPRLELRLDGH